MAVTVTAATALLAAGCSGSADGDDVSGAGDVRTVKDSQGTVEVPKDAKRVVTLHHIATQPLVDIGIVPVGRGEVARNMVDAKTWKKFSDVPVVSDGAEPDLEKIAALKSDLAIAHNSLDQTALKTLKSDVAPVLTLDIAGPGRADWGGRVDLVAKSLGRGGKSDALKKKLRTRAEKISTTYGTVLKKETFTLVDAWSSGGEFTTYGSDSIPGTVLTTAGVRIGAGADDAAKTSDKGDHEVTTSTERLPKLVDGSVVLYGTDLRAKPAGHVDDVMKTKLFSSLPAATADQVYPGGKNTVGGYEDAHYIPDRLEAALKKLDAAT